MSESIELVAEYLAAALTCLVLILFVRHSRRFGVEHQQGWLAISIGFSLLLFGTLVEIALDYPELRALFPPSNTWTALLFELTLSGQLLAVVFLAFGFRRWMPALRALHDAQQSLREHHEVLEQRVEERTEELAEANQRIRAESAGQQRIASELRESQRRLETLLGNLPGMAYRGRCELWRPMEFVSDGCVELTGYPAEVLVGGEVVSFGALIHDDDREPVQRLIGQALERGDRFQLEYRLHTAQGRERVVWEQGAGVYDDAGELLAIEGLVVDITQRKRVEDRLRLASLIIDNALEGIVVTDPSGEIMMVNPAFTAITGYSAEEAIGRTPALLKSGRHDGPFYRRMWHEITTHGTWRGEIWNRRKNGEIYPQWLTVTAIRGHAGAIHQLIGIFSDITQRK
ncbi:MAG TPA: PAS domain S-box protein, partial [Gammaproteobacteria bacterium]